MLFIFRSLIVFYFFIRNCTAVYADDLFATGWGHAFDSSAEGQLVFILLQAGGIYYCLRSLRLLYAYQMGKQTQYGNWSCAMRFIAGTLLFYGHESANLIYNSF